MWNKGYSASERRPDWVPGGAENKGDCEEIITEYSVSGNVVQTSSTGGNIACMKRKFDSETRKMLESAGIR